MSRRRVCTCKSTLLYILAYTLSIPGIGGSDQEEEIHYNQSRNNPAEYE